MSEPLLTVENLKTQFFTEEGTVRAVDGVNFEVNEGELVGLVGESGAGKSVAAQSIMRLVEEPGRIVDGTVTFDGKKLVDIEETPDGRMEESDEMLSNREMREQVRGREIAIVFQDPMESLNPVFKVGAQLREFIELNRGVNESEAKTIAVDMLREVGIPEPEARYDDYPHEFSGGMRQRVLIAMALACEPRLIIADEPTTALDVTVEGQILDLVSDLQERYDTAFLWVTHDMGVVAEICDRVNVMYLGEVIEEAEVDDLFHDTKHPYTEALLRSMPRPDRSVESLDPIKGVMPEAINPPSGCRFHTRCPEAREACKEFHPEYQDVSDADEAPHAVSCIKYERVGYEDSDPLQTEATGAFAGGLADMRGDDDGRDPAGVPGGEADE
ncbi:ATP-binding cassette domain-containing protein [Halobaculum sp. WSA2]|uniref:Nickel import system ATP-binding protein NikD n=1 Tax=Halobaculum saliterrae TaxID=2073113 RepID=A0A6B0T005_9EURY|nr:ABC transporter ATP-binding protein [Halobaculum saliterrae]MXR39979.1 ATP-binding cassette domain-containing protein [Halobaculum saliterrae]